jgi:16S rRNA C967 or C1407 C5-methylase (RsmB/RsmF family)
MAKTPREKAKEALIAKAKTIRDLEAEAKKKLKEDQAQEEYNRLLRDKARTIHSLLYDLQDELEGLPEELQDQLESALENMGVRASQALEVDSPFFMAMLLYPDDYTEGEENELEQLITRTLDREG